LLSIIARYIVIHAGNVDGFIPHVGKIFKAKTDSREYHTAMNAEIFEKWVKDLCSALEEPSLILLDNASYHSRQKEKRPTTAWKKCDLQNWLEENNIPYNATDKKDTLLNICKNNYTEKKYAVNEIIEQAGHEVLRLPPYHCIFNAIEMVWSQAKRSYDKELIKPNMDPIKAWTHGLETVTSEQWGNYFRHTHKCIAEYWEREKFLIRTVQEIIINVNVNTDSSDSDFDLKGCEELQCS
jgi:transposase